MKLQKKQQTQFENKKINNKTNDKEYNSMELKIKQQNSKISHLLEKVDNLQKNNDNIMLLLEELLYTVSNNDDIQLKSEFDSETTKKQVLQHLIKLN